MVDEPKTEMALSNTSGFVLTQRKPDNGLSFMMKRNGLSLIRPSRLQVSVGAFFNREKAAIKQTVGKG